MKRLVVGVIGHVDHGKTALVRALTGMETDRLPEEQQRGISIALGFAHFAPASDCMIDLIDMPGHEKFVRTMVGGATGIDAVLLVVAANEGIAPQSVEHAEVAALLGIERAVIAVTKADLVSADEAELAGEAAAELLGGLGLQVRGCVMTSAQSAQGIAALGEALHGLANSTGARPQDGLPFLPIDRAFVITGHGPVVTGTLHGAALAVGDKLALLPANREVRVRALQVHGSKLERAEPGQRVAVNLRGVEIADLDRGMVLSAPDALTPADWVTLALRAADSAPPLKNGMRLRALAGTQEVDVRLRLLDRDVLEPGERALAQIKCVLPLAVPVREHVVLRIASPARTVAGGLVLECSERRLRRNDAGVLDRFDVLHALSPADTVLAEARRAGRRGTTLAALSRIAALAPWRVAELLRAQAFAVSRSGEVIPAEEAEQRRRKLVVRPDAVRLRDDAERAADLARSMRQAGLMPPTPKELAIDAASHRAVERLLRDGVLVRTTDRAKGKEIVFHRDAIAAAREKLAPLLRQGEGLLVTEIAAHLGISRKFCMPLLDYLDSVRFTRRAGDRRVLNGPA